MPLEVGLAALGHIHRREINVRVYVCCVCEKETKTETEKVREGESGKTSGWRLLFKPVGSS